MQIWWRNDRVDSAGQCSVSPGEAPHSSRLRAWSAVVGLVVGAFIAPLCPARAAELLVAAPQGQAVLPSPSATTSLIGLPVDFFDPGAGASEGRARLQRVGIPRFARLSPAERVIETRLADAVQRDPASAVQGMRALAEASGSPDLPVFEVDAAKLLFEGYGSGRRPANAAELGFRLRFNHVLHPSAVAIARLAFLERLDQLSALPDDDVHRLIFVTNGGCAAGKGDLLTLARSALGDKAQFGAVWDSAGEGDALENAWILRAAQKRRLKVLFGFAQADPATRYASVLSRAELSGRVVDVLTFVDSYSHGAEVFRNFLASGEYRAAVASGMATTIGIAPGEFDLASLKDRSLPEYPHAHGLNPPGQALEVAHLAEPPNKEASLLAALEILELHVQTARAAGRDVGPLLVGALGRTLKFLDDEEPAVRDLILRYSERLAPESAARDGQG